MRYLPLVACTKDQLLGSIFNNRGSFVNSSLHLVLCGDGVYICKIKKNKVPCHAVADKLLAKWSPMELWQSETEKLGDRDQNYLKQNVDCNLCRSCRKSI